MKRYHFNKKVWLENGVPMTTISGVGMQAHALIHKPTRTQTVAMLRRVRTAGRFSLSALAVYFGTTRGTVKQWLSSKRVPSGPSTRAIWLAYLSYCSPQTLADPGAFIFWTRPGIDTKLSPQEFLVRVQKRYKSRRTLRISTG